MPNPVPPSQPTMPNPALQPRGQATRHNQPTVRQAIPVPKRPATQAPPARPQQYAPAPLQLAHQLPKKKKSYRGMWILGFVVMSMVMMCVGTVMMGMVMIYGSGILPSVTVSDVALGGLSEAEAVSVLQKNWDSIILRENERTWDINPATLGITLDANATAKRAYAMGRTTGNPLSAIIGRVSISPVITLNKEVALTEMSRIAETVNIEPIDASVGFENGQVVAIPPQNGKSIDIQATVDHFTQEIQSNINQGEIKLVMVDIAPTLNDVSGIVAQAQALLSNPLDIRVYDPVTGDSVYWSVMPNEWGQWLSVSSDSNSAIGLALDANQDAVRAYLTNQANSVLDSTRTLDIEAGVNNVVQSIRQGTPERGFVQVKHQERIHTVQSGETITSIAWDYGVPYLYIQNLNNGIDSVSVGQQIRIPPADIFLTDNVNPAKRIVVNISGQTVKVYENDQLKWDWVASTGIPDSPTWTGVYQIQSHIDNAYAANWNLNMPNFMGVYQPVPGADFTNGFHGFPTRNGGQLLWENSLGRKVTYGCILLHDTNMQQLYSWAETGVVVEIQA